MVPNRFRQTLFLLALVGGLTFLSGCRVSVTYPSFGSVIIGGETDIRIEYPDGVMEDFSVLLNGDEIGDSFSHVGPSPEGWMLAIAEAVPVAPGAPNQLLVSMTLDGIEETAVSAFQSQAKPDPTGLVDGSGRADGFLDLDFDRFGLPHIAYFDAETNSVRYARFVPGTGFAATSLYGFGEEPVGHFSQLAVNDDRSAYIAFHDQEAGTLNLLQYHDYYIETMVIDGSVDEVVGLYPSMEKDESGVLWISYYDQTNGDLKLAVGDEFGFDISVIDGAGVDVGMWSSLALAPDGKICVSYYDNTNHDLRYAEGYGLPLAIETFEDMAWSGSDTSLALFSDGDPAIAFFNESELDLYFAHRDGGTWYQTMVLNAGAVGFYNSLVIDPSDRVFITTVDLSFGALMLAYSSNYVDFTIDLLAAQGPDSQLRYTSMLYDPDGYLGLAYCDYNLGELWYLRHPLPSEEAIRW